MSFIDRVNVGVAKLTGLHILYIPSCLIAVIRFNHSVTPHFATIQQCLDQYVCSRNHVLSLSSRCPTHFSQFSSSVTLLLRYLPTSSWSDSVHRDGYLLLWSVFCLKSRKEASWNNKGLLVTVPNFQSVLDDTVSLRSRHWFSLNIVGFTRTYHSILALRFCKRPKFPSLSVIEITLGLGLFESGLFPGLNFFLTGWYRREEINKRCAVFFAGAVLAGAFGGLFGFALSRITTSHYEGWSWIFIIEWVITFLVAIGSIWMVHDWPDQASFLTPLEREMVITRIKQEQGLAGEGKFSGKMVIKALKDWKTYTLMLMYIGAAVPLYA